MTARDSHRSPGDICLVTPLPPPTTGLAILNQCMRDALVRAGHNPIIINVSPFSLERSLRRRLGRIRRILAGIGRYVYYLLSGRIRSVYLSVSGGPGQFYDLAFVAAARTLRKRVFLHHHSYAYINRRRLLTSILVRFAGRSANHFVLCKDQGQRLTALYPLAKRVSVVSNPALLEHLLPNSSSPRSALRTIGFFSNISFEKGVLDFLDLVTALQGAAVGVRAVIGGPFQGREVQKAVMNRLVTSPGIEYLGPKYGAEKFQFYEKIDVLVFPTRYRNETAPVTIYEALALSVPVIARERGCIRNMIAGSMSLSVPYHSDFVHEAARQITEWVRLPDQYRQASIASRSHFLRLLEESRTHLRAGLERIAQTSGVEDGRRGLPSP